MLIIAQPKSASTSLLKTLSKIVGIPYQNGLGKEIGWKYCEGFPEIQKYHDTTIKRDMWFLKPWIIKRNTILKEHILPTEYHKNIIKEVNGKVLIILRNPKDSFDNYKRLYNQYKKRELEKEVIDELMPYRFKKINMDLFLQDLIMFNSGWQEFNFEKKLIVYYEDLILDYKKTMEKIIKFWDFKNIKKILPLYKAKGNHGYNTYTGVGEERLKEWRNKK